MTIKLICQRCGYEWDYRGKREYSALCPNCRTHVNIKKQKQALAKPAPLARPSPQEGGALT